MLVAKHGKDYLSNDYLLDQLFFLTERAPVHKKHCVYIFKILCIGVKSVHSTSFDIVDFHYIINITAFSPQFRSVQQDWLKNCPIK